MGVIYFFFFIGVLALSVGAMTIGILEDSLLLSIFLLVVGAGLTVFSIRMLTSKLKQKSSEGKLGKTEKIGIAASLLWMALGLYQLVSFFINVGGLFGIFEMFDFSYASSIPNLFFVISCIAAIFAGLKFMGEERANIYIPIALTGIAYVANLINSLVAYKYFNFYQIIYFLPFALVALMYSSVNIPVLRKIWFVPALISAVSYLLPILQGNLQYVDWIGLLLETGAILSAGYLISACEDVRAETEKINWSSVGAVAFVIGLIIIVIICFAGDPGSNSDIGRDPDGFLGYSDDFWDWYMDHGYIA